MKFRTISTILALVFAIATYGQEMTIKDMHVAEMDISAAHYSVDDYNGNACGLVKVQLAREGAVFEGNVFGTPAYKTGEYWVYMTEGSYMLGVKCPGCVPLFVNFRDYGIRRVESKVTYVLTILLPNNGAPVDTDDGMRYLILKVSPATATVFIDDKLQQVKDGGVSALLPRGAHTYRVEAAGFSPQSGTVELADGRKTVEVELESALAQVTVTCPTAGAQIYVNEDLKGSSPWTGSLAEGNYQIEARLAGHRPQKQSVAIAEKEQRNVELPELMAITGSLNIDYKPLDSEVWLDGKKIGVSPDVFRNIIVGSHSVEVRAKGYQTVKKTVTIAEGQTAQVSGELNASPQVSPQSSPNGEEAQTDSWANSSASSSNSSMPVPEAVDLGLSVKWASFNLGASKPEEYGYYYKWGETKPADTGMWSTYKYAKGSSDKLTKYCTSKKYGYNRFRDGKTKLEPMDDAATVNLGGSWRMPTYDEIRELRSKCTREWTTINGIKGIRVIGPNGRWIFFPASGQRYLDGSLYAVGSWGFYWSASTDSEFRSHYLGFYDNSWYWGSSSRADGYPVRPVLAE